MDLLWNIKIDSLVLNGQITLEELDQFDSVLHYFFTWLMPYLMANTAAWVRSVTFSLSKIELT
jgi:hypothetical protein